MLGGTLSTSPAQFTASMFVNKTKTTLRAHTVDKNTSSVSEGKTRIYIFITYLPRSLYIFQ